MKAVIVETNVLVVANQQSNQATPECVLTCVDLLEKIIEKKIVVIDSGERFFKEYRRYACLSGQPGAGDAFLKWLYRNQCYQKKCEQVDITPKTDNNNDFEEFPNDPELNCFDFSDRKFVAVARASRYKVKILNATDSDWWNFRQALSKNGVKIEFLCSELFKKSV